MAANDVNLHILTKTIVCLNGMRELRWAEAVTNINVRYVTNAAVTAVTNLTVTRSENQFLSSNTNNSPPIPVLALVDAADPGTAPTNSSAASAIAPAPEGSTSGLITSTTSNESFATAPNQTVLSKSTQVVTTINNQGTQNADGQSVLGGTNRTITLETNYVINSITNYLVTPVTNVLVKSPEGPTYDYYLYTEIAPADFQLAPGESLVVLIDGERHAFSPSQPASMHQTRRNFQTTFYRVPPDVLTGIANAKEVKIRLRSTTGGLDRKLNIFSRQRFRAFLEAQTKGTPSEVLSVSAAAPSTH